MQTTTQTTRATDILKAEHQVILGILDCLEKVAEDVARAAALDVRSAKEALDFLATFADRCHHAKEETCLFPALHASGMPRDVGPVAVMLAEHDEGRELIAAMRECVEASVRGDCDAHRLFQGAARAYVALLREHIAKENNVLFPMADAMLSEGAQDALLDAFATLEVHDMGAGTHERYLELAQGLARRLGVTPRTQDAGPMVCCGHAGRCH